MVMDGEITQATSCVLYEGERVIAESGTEGGREKGETGRHSSVAIASPIPRPSVSPSPQVAIVTRCR